MDKYIQVIELTLSGLESLPLYFSLCFWLFVPFFLFSLQESIAIIVFGNIYTGALDFSGLFKHRHFKIPYFVFKINILTTGVCMINLRGDCQSVGKVFGGRGLLVGPMSHHQSYLPRTWANASTSKL